MMIFNLLVVRCSIRQVPTSILQPNQGKFQQMSRLVDEVVKGVSQVSLGYISYILIFWWNGQASHEENQLNLMTSSDSWRWKKSWSSLRAWFVKLVVLTRAVWRPEVCMYINCLSLLMADWWHPNALKDPITSFYWALGKTNRPTFRIKQTTTAF